MTTTYEVRGMTCDHCVETVSHAVRALPGVAAVEVDLSTGQVEVSGEQPPSAEVVRAAVEEVGYEFVELANGSGG